MAKRRFRKRRFRRRGRKSMKSMVTRQIKNYEKKHTELKYHDYTLNQLTDYNGVVVDLSIILQGISDTTRIADKLKLHDMKVHGSINIQDTYNNVRMIFFVWKESDAAFSPGVADILQTTTIPGISSPFSNYYWDGRDRFKILSDKTYLINWQNGSATPGAVVNANHFKFYKKLDKLKEVAYFGGGVTGINKIYLLMISDSPSITDPLISGTVRITYTDG